MLVHTLRLIATVSTLQCTYNREFPDSKKPCILYPSMQIIQPNIYCCDFAVEPISVHCSYAQVVWLQELTRNDKSFLSCTRGIS